MYVCGPLHLHPFICLGEYGSMYVRICKKVFMLQFPIKTRTRNSLPPEAYETAYGIHTEAYILYGTAFNIKCLFF